MGDVNGDGYPDFAVGAPQHASSAGRVYLFYGNGSYSGEVPLALADATFSGEAPGDLAGSFVAALGDTNGDGFDDILVAAPQYDSDRGKVYVVYGAAAPDEPRGDIPLGTGANGSFTGAAQGDVLGQSISGLGDFNGDGLADIALGTAGAKSAYVVYGNASLRPDSPVEHAANASFRGESGGDFGVSLAGVGDVNGDGLADLAAGDGWNRRSYLVFGNGSLRPDSLVEHAANVTIGDPLEPSLGYWVSGAGDVNGDGYFDFLVSSQGPGQKGKVSLFYGSPMLSGHVDAWRANASFTGESNYDDAGFRTTGVGDVDGDGYGDFLMGAFGYGGGTGRAYLFLGNATLAGNLSVALADASFTGAVATDRAGTGVGNASDLDRDGYCDFFVGAYNASGGGALYLFFGSTEAPPSASGVQVGPNAPTTVDSLVLSYSYSDEDGDPEQGTRVEWYRSGVHLPELDGFLAVPAMWTNKSQKWRATVTPGDGFQYGAAVSSNAVVVANTPPTVSGVTLSPPRPGPIDNLTVGYSYSDPDGDPDLSLVEWFVDGVHVAPLDNLTVVPAAWINASRRWVARVTGFDGEILGDASTSGEVTVGAGAGGDVPGFPLAWLAGSFIVDLVARDLGRCRRIKLAREKHH
ncbi:MAG: FG-GAP-like repeat-containing protein [Promethearchaeota archaeon]